MFKAGDLVRCNDPYTHKVPKGGLCNVVFDKNTGYIKFQYQDYEATWASHRFTLVEPKAQAIAAPATIIPAAPVPLTRDNAKVGMKVVCVKGDAHPYPLQESEEYVVSAVEDERVKLVGHPLPSYLFKRFVIAPEPLAAPRPLGVGDKIVCVEGYRPAGLVARAEYTIKKLTDKLISVEEIPGKLFKRSRFSFPAVAPEPPVAERPIAVGDMVYVVAKVEKSGRDANCGWYAEKMDHLLNNGVAYRVIEIEIYGRIRIKIDEDYNWVYRPECLSHSHKAPVAPPKPLPVDKTQEMLVHLRKQKPTRVITGFAIKRIGIEDVEYYPFPACYAPINYKDKPIEIFILDTHAHQKIHNGAANDYVNWLMNDSPWAPCFITKDVVKAMEEGIVMDCNKPIGHLVSAALAFREATENEQRLPIWNQMFKAGYHGNTAYLMSLSVAKDKAGKYSRLDSKWGHVSCYTAMDTGDFISFFKNGFKARKQKAANAPGVTHYAIDVQITERAEGDRFCDWLHPFLKTTVVGTGFHANKQITERTIFECASMLEPLVIQEKK